MTNCEHCTNDLEHCHATVLVQDDGTTECLADEPCSLDADLHEWTVTQHDLLIAA